MLKEVYGQTIKILRILLHHSVWKSQKKSYSTFWILSGRKFIKIAQNGQFSRILENLELVVKKCYQTYGIFLAIFKQCGAEA